VKKEAKLPGGEPSAPVKEAKLPESTKLKVLFGAKLRDELGAIGVDEALISFIERPRRGHLVLEEDLFIETWAALTELQESPAVGRLDHVVVSKINNAQSFVDCLAG